MGTMGERLGRALAAAGVEAAVSWVASTGSTNDDAKRAAGGISVFVADEQTAGRGRSGNAWRSAPGEGLLLSVLLRPELSPHACAEVTLVVGEAIARVLDAFAPGRVKIKWPNDIEIDAKKVAGILVEAQTRGEKLSGLVVGVGINVASETLPPGLEAIATSLARAGARGVDRVELAARVVLAIVSAVDGFVRDGLGPVLEGVRARDALFGERIRVGDVLGEAAGVDDRGRLGVRVAGGALVPVTSGHVERLGKLR
jgi:BirA family biotin operon repressor/biotin-[acetyl-CoA-carboxylase] ligase